MPTIQIYLRCAEGGCDAKATHVVDGHGACAEHVLTVMAATLASDDDVRPANRPETP